MAADLACVVHVHSTYSDGTATVPELLAATRHAGADVLVLTDHDTLGARRDGWEGWHDGVLLVVGMEVSPRGGHLLALGVDELVPHAGRSEDDILRDVAEQGGLAIAAHPFSEGSRMSRRIGRPHPWGALGNPACAGVELWSMTTDTAEDWASPRAAIRELRAPERLDGPPAGHLARWDALCRRRPTVAIGGLDAHQPGVRLRGRVRSIMPHARWFSLLRTHVLLEEPPRGDASDASRVVEALRAGRCYLALDHLGDPAGFAFSAARPGERAVMGAGAGAGEWTLRAEAPGADGLRLLADGELAEASEGPRLEHAVSGAGVFRVEAWRAGRRWIVGNPVYLGRP